MRPIDLPDRCMSLPEVAQLTGYRLWALQEGCRRGRIRHQRLGRQRVMTPEQVRELLAATQVTPTEPVDADTARVAEHRTRVATRLARRAGAA